LLRKLCAAFCAAVSLSGWTSSASIDSEWSVTIITEARPTGTATVRCGLASASARSARAASASAAGACRRQEGPAAAAASLRLRTAVKRTA
jgi:hypothetical protein